MKWFKHDSDANRDPKLEKVLMKYGAEGYALYWLCLELVAAPIDKHNLNFELEHDSEIMAYRLKMDSIRVEEIMRFMVSVNLFECDPTTQRITCLKLAHRLENSVVKNPQLKEIQQLIPLQSRTIQDNPGQSRTIQDNPGQTRLDKNRLDIKDMFKPNGSNDSFSEFWSRYPRKANKKKAQATWKRLTKTNQQAALKDIQTRYEGVEKQFIPLATTYLNGERWNDEPIPKVQPKRKAPMTDDEIIKRCEELGISTKGKTRHELQARLQDLH